MDRTPVTSSNIKSIGYEGGVLEVEFLGKKADAPGAVYRYEGVPIDVHADLMSAPSIGRAFGLLIRNGGFAVEKVEPEPKAEQSTQEV